MCVIVNAVADVILNMARPILESVKELSEDYSNRTLNTRTQEKATVTNIAKVHIAIRDLMTHKNNVSLEQDPFTLLWITNCVLFSAVIAFLLCKGWRRGKNNSQENRRGSEMETKERYETQRVKSGKICQQFKQNWTK